MPLYSRDDPHRPATDRLMINKSLRGAGPESSSKANYGFQPVGPTRSTHKGGDLGRFRARWPVSGGRDPPWHRCSTKVGEVAPGAATRETTGATILPVMPAQPWSGAALDPKS